MGGYSPESSAKVSGGGVGSVGRNKGAPKGDIEGQIPKALKPQAKPKPKQTAFPGFLGVHRLPLFLFLVSQLAPNGFCWLLMICFLGFYAKRVSKTVFWVSGCSQRAFVFRIF